MNKHTKRTAEHLEYSFWLIFDDDGSVRLLRALPSVGRNERAMSMTAKLPLSLFKTPQLSATLTVDAPAVEPMVVDLRAASEALSMAIGVDVDLQVNTEASRIASRAFDAVQS